MSETINLNHGAGGFESSELLKEIRGILKEKGDWTNTGDDAAVYDLGEQKLLFTTDAFIVDPIFFLGGDIGKIAICGTINDLSVMGGRPIGISLSIVIEEGFPKEDLLRIINSINKVSKDSGVPVVTGDTKVTDRGKLDKVEITTSGVGLAKKIIQNNGIKVGDIMITSGDLGEHTVALLSKRFNYKSNVKSDCKPMNKELLEVGNLLNACKDPTRGGLAANLAEMAEKSKVKVILDEEHLPYKKETLALSGLLGIDYFSFASEGRFIASVSPNNVQRALKILQKFNKEAKVIGKAEKGSGVFLKTSLGALRPIEMPRGKLIPRIC